MSSAGTVVAYLQSVFVPLAAFPASEAPNWRIGAKMYLGFAVAVVPLYISMHFVFRWEQRKKAGRGMQ